MIAIHFPEELIEVKHTSRMNTMHNIRHNPRPLTESFIIQEGSSTTSRQEAASPKLNLSAMKIFNRFRKIIMRLLFSIPSSPSPSSPSSSATQQGMTAKKRNSCDRFEPPKTSCSSYYSSHSHYNEAIADCIEFFNKSSQDDHEIILDDPDQSGCHMVWYIYIFIYICFTHNIYFLLFFTLFLIQVWSLLHFFFVSTSNI